MIWKTIQWTANLLFWIPLALVFAGMFKNRGSAKILSDGQIEFAPRWFGVWAWIFLAFRTSFVIPNYLKQGFGKPWDFVTGALLGAGRLGGPL